MDTISIIHFRNYDTFLCIFNYKINAESKLPILG